MANGDSLQSWQPMTHNSFAAYTSFGWYACMSSAYEGHVARDTVTRMLYVGYGEGTGARGFLTGFHPRPGKHHAPQMLLASS